MSDTRLNRQKLVNFHPTGSNIVSALNGSHWDGSTTKRPLFYYPLGTESSGTSKSTVFPHDHSGQANHGRMYYTTGTDSGEATSTWLHKDVPWGANLRRGKHKYSVLVNEMTGSKNDPGWSMQWNNGES